MSLEIIYDLQRSVFVAYSHVKKFSPNDPRYWQAVSEVRVAEDTLRTYKQVWGV